MRTAIHRSRTEVRFEMPAADVDELILRASEHPFGTEFLLHGMLDSVASAFGVHAFLVEAARESLRPASQPRS